MFKAAQQFFYFNEIFLNNIRDALLLLMYFLLNLKQLTFEIKGLCHLYIDERIEEKMCVLQSLCVCVCV